jgi:hypothetical protein
VTLLEKADVGLEQIRQAISSFGEGSCNIWVIVNEMNNDGLLEIEEVLDHNGTIVKNLKREGKTTPLGIFAYVWKR